MDVTTWQGRADSRIHEFGERCWSCGPNRRDGDGSVQPEAFARLVVCDLMCMVTIEELRQRLLPFVAADQEGLIVEINDLFESVYGWSLADLRGQSLSMILPDSFKDAHHLGFSRFRIVGESQILNHPLELMTICKDQREINSEHFIVAERRGDSWVFAATLRPLS
ncbi:MAG: PAS domain S-box protein [Prochlorococcaceae cyanobacterium]